MKTNLYLLITIIMISFWTGLLNVSGNNVSQNNETILLMQNVKVGLDIEIASTKLIEIMNLKLVYAKLDTTRDDYIFISVRPLASGINSVVSGFKSISSSGIVNKRFDHLAGVYYFDPEANRIKISQTYSN